MTEKKEKFTKIESGDCGNCGCFVYYISSGRCVCCASAYAQANAEKYSEARKKRVALRRAKGTILTGNSCSKCGGNKRYSCLSCVKCKKENGATYAQERIKRAHKANKILFKTTKKGRQIKLLLAEKECIKCGGKLLYLPAGQCVGCKKIEYLNKKERCK